jgi:hypothetical protein
MYFDELLRRELIDPKQVVALRHHPREPALRKVLPWLAAEKPELYNAFQQAQNIRAEGAMKKASYVASFVERESSKALFVGLYRVTSYKSISHKQYWKIPANIELQKLGMTGFTGDRPHIVWFELDLLDFYKIWRGKLIVQWPAGRLWWRWVDRNKIPVDAVSEENLLTRDMPDWKELILSWDALSVLPSSWSARLSQWRGIYLILDGSDGKGYVGSAYGSENLLGRWRNYGKSGHGGNRRLRERNPRNLRFCILQLVSQDLSSVEAIYLENTWKERLGTKKFGLNAN